MTEHIAEIKTFPTNWIAVSRETFAHDVIGSNTQPPPPADKSRAAWFPFMLWIWLLGEAAHKPRMRSIQGREVALLRGQLVVSVRFLSTKANWTPKAVRGWLDRLRRNRMIETNVTRGTQLLLELPGQLIGRPGHKKGTGITVVTICNYDKYQMVPAPKGNSRAIQGHTPDPKLTLNKEQGGGEKGDSSLALAGTHKRGTRLPDDWVLPKSYGDWALINYSPDREEVRALGERFRDHWIAKIGRDATKRDWFATWRNWCRNERRPGKRGNVISFQEKEREYQKQVREQIQL